MTPLSPKEKSEELIKQFKPYMYCFMGSGMLTNSIDESVERSNAIQCALICVEEILASGVESSFWFEVKQYLLTLK